MKPIRIRILLLILSMPIMSTTQTPGGFNKYRTLLVFAPTTGHTLYKELNASIGAHEESFAERDLVTYRVFATSGLSPHGQELLPGQVDSLRRQYEVMPGEFVVVLVGKDRTEKMRWRNVVETLEGLFARIDSMPMRQREMREKGKGWN